MLYELVSCLTHTRLIILRIEENEMNKVQVIINFSEKKHKNATQYKK